LTDSAEIGEPVGCVRMHDERFHAMPFGAQPAADGRIQFRLWAPAAQTVDLVLDEPHGARTIPMRRIDRGFHEIQTAAAHIGSRYRFRIDGGLLVPDPAARASVGAHGPSIVVDPRTYRWRDGHWHGRPWHEAVIYELHVGAFSPEGTFAAIRSRLDHFVRLGTTMIELMPIAQFAGTRGWGYDGVLPYAPFAHYGTPDELKALVDAAHERGLAMLLDVVYNHFGPEGNWLGAYAPQFFTARHRTPWGEAVNFDGEDSRTVREFFIHNALYWLEEYHFDGLRIDAVHALRDDGRPHIVDELTARVREAAGIPRHVHVILENHANEAARLRRSAGQPGADAQWNEDLHHCLHVILTGERDGYYSDFADRPHERLVRALAEGFAYQGEPSSYGGGRPRGEPSAALPPTAFVSFVQNHDQIGNRPHGERLEVLAGSDQAWFATIALVLLAPGPPMLFMGEEWAAAQPFLYFCDFEPDLAAKVRAGRRREFERFAGFGESAVLPDPGAVETFRRSTLDWSQTGDGRHALWLERYRRLLAIRAREIVPLLPAMRSGHGRLSGANGSFQVEWPTNDGILLRVSANLSSRGVSLDVNARGRRIFTTADDTAPGFLGPWSTTWEIDRIEDHARIDR
jgi:maltooligosyltrehalose trehalohydrolase